MPTRQADAPHRSSDVGRGVGHKEFQGAILTLCDFGLTYHAGFGVINKKTDLCLRYVWEFQRFRSEARCYILKSCRLAVWWRPWGGHGRALHRLAWPQPACKAAREAAATVAPRPKLEGQWCLLPLVAFFRSEVSSLYMTADPRVKLVAWLQGGMANNFPASHRGVHTHVPRLWEAWSKC